MEHGFKIVGKNMSEEKREDFGKRYQEIEKRSVLPLKAEMEKNEKAEEIIRAINSWLRKEFEQMGLEYKDIPQEKIHIFFEDDYKKEFPEEKESVIGFASSVKREACIKAVEDKARVFKCILHEMIHLASHNVYYGNIAEDVMTNYRSGYANINWNNKEDVKQHFKGLNEGVVDMLASEIVQDNLDEVFRLTATRKEDWKNVEWYGEEGDIVNAILDKIAVHKNEKRENVYARFKKGLFSGEMMHLRDIEKAFGKDSLRILAYWDPTADVSGVSEKDIYEKIYEFFTTADEKKRNEIREVLISSIGEK